MGGRKPAAGRHDDLPPGEVPGDKHRISLQPDLRRKGNAEYHHGGRRPHASACGGGDRAEKDPLPHSAFTQELLIYKGKRQAFKRADRLEYYRALCRIGENLCVVDGTHKHLLVSFVDLLINAGVTDALYLDMGDWKYSWMRKYPDDDERCKAEIIYEKPQGKEYYGSNWLVFQYVN